MAMTDEQNRNIASFYFANASDPGKIADAMKQYGVSASDLANAVAGQNGVTANDVQNHVARIGVQTGNGAGFGGNTSSQQQTLTNWHADRNAAEAERQALLAGVKPGASGGGESFQHKPAMNLGMGGQQASGSNPYLGQHAAAITNQVTQNLQRNILPNIGGGAMAAGGYGGSRQGVVEANALNDANQGLSNALAGMYSQDWNAQQGRDLQRYGMDQSFNLGMGNLGLGAMNANNNFFTAQRGQDLQAAGLGAQLVQQGNQGFLNQGQGMFNIGNTYQNAPWQTVGNFGNTLNQWGNQTGSVSGSQSSNPWASALGGALGGWQLYNNFTSKPASA